MGNPGGIGKTAIEATTVGSTSPSPVVQEVNLNLELGLPLEDQTAERVVDIDQAPTRLLVKSHVRARGAKGLRSPQYLATIRRREAGKIGGLIAELATHEGSEDFVAWTHEPLDELRRLIHRLTEAEEFSNPEHEGNSCEILRQLRDTLLNTGWERYQESAVRDAAVKILQHLATADEVSADDAYDAMNQLLDLDLNPTVGPAWQNAEDKVPD
ncbi:MAG: hypothetical protein ACYTG0_02915 [Planctomycetota bacterium]|jgi:hypothetical protein